MEKFRKQEIKKSHIPENDNGISVKRLKKLVEGNEYYGEIMELLEIENMEDDFINIPGATTLYNIISHLNETLVKIDLVSSLENISFYNEGEFTINFEDYEDNEYLASHVDGLLNTTPKYSATKDFFSNLYQMDKYASSLIRAGHRNILEENLRLIKMATQNERKYRIIHDTEDDKFYLRGIISTKNYFNYDNNLAIVVGLLTLHQEMISSGKQYSLLLCEYSESYIRMFFESSDLTPLENIGYVKNIVEVSNDEIKREALKFTGVNSILFEDSSQNNRELFITPKNITSKILSIKHNQSPSTAMQELIAISNTDIVHKELLRDIQTIKNIKEPEALKFHFRSKVENARNNELKIYKDNILKALYANVKNIVQLLELFDKIYLVANKDMR